MTQCYEIIRTVLASIQTEHYPNLEAICRMLSGSDQEECERLMRVGLDCVEPGLEYFDHTMNGVLKNTLQSSKTIQS